MSLRYVEDVALLAQNKPTGLEGVDSILRFAKDATPEVINILKNECDVILECRYCRNLFRSVPNFLTHKRTYCRGLHHVAVAHAQNLRKAIEEEAEKLEKDQNKKSERITGHLKRTNIIGALNKRSTEVEVDVPGLSKNLLLHTLPRICKEVPVTVFEDGVQKIVDMPMNMPQKEGIPEDKIVVVMPQDHSSKYREMQLRNRNRDTQGKQETTREYTIAEVAILEKCQSYYPQWPDAASLRCMHPDCNNTRCFGSIQTLVYHVAIKHGTRCTPDSRIPCLLCKFTLKTWNGYVSHLTKIHKFIREEHEQFRNKEFSDGDKKKFKKNHIRNRSMSPPPNPEEEKSEAKDDENEDSSPPVIHPVTTTLTEESGNANDTDDEPPQLTRMARTRREIKVPKKFLPESPIRPRSQRDRDPTPNKSPLSRSSSERSFPGCCNELDKTDENEEKEDDDDIPTEPPVIEAQYYFNREGSPLDNDKSPKEKEEEDDDEDGNHLSDKDGNDSCLIDSELKADSSEEIAALMIPNKSLDESEESPLIDKEDIDDQATDPAIAPEDETNDFDESYDVEHGEFNDIDAIVKISESREGSEGAQEMAIESVETASISSTPLANDVWQKDESDVQNAVEFLVSNSSQGELSAKVEETLSHESTPLSAEYEASRASSDVRQTSETASVTAENIDTSDSQVKRPSSQSSIKTIASAISVLDKTNDEESDSEYYDVRNSQKRRRGRKPKLDSAHKNTGSDDETESPVPRPSRKRRRPEWMDVFYVEDEGDKRSSTRKNKKEDTARSTPEVSLDDVQSKLKVLDSHSKRRLNTSMAESVLSEDKLKISIRLTSPLKKKVVIINKNSSPGTNELTSGSQTSSSSNVSTQSLSTPKRSSAERESNSGSSHDATTASPGNRRKQSLPAVGSDPDDVVRVISDNGKPKVPTGDLSSVPVYLSQAQKELFFSALKPKDPSKQINPTAAGSSEATVGTGPYLCEHCNFEVPNLKEGRRHMVSHIRVMRLRCTLCGAGSFFCTDMRSHLMERCCPMLSKTPPQMLLPGKPCMTRESADKLTEVVDKTHPGRVMYTSGKIVSQSNRFPYLPDPKIEEAILGRPIPSRSSPSKRPQPSNRPVNFSV